MAEITPVQPASRKLKIALAVSLALNLGVAGIVGGAIIKGGGGRHGDMVRDLDFGPFTQAFDLKDRAALRSAFLERAPELRAARKEMRTDFAAVLTALRADPFDAAALNVALVGQSERAAKNLAIGQTLVAERIAQMTPEARIAFADRLEDGLTKGRARKP